MRSILLAPYKPTLSTMSKASQLTGLALDIIFFFVEIKKVASTTSVSARTCCAVESRSSNDQALQFVYNERLSEGSNE